MKPNPAKTCLFAVGQEVVERSVAPGGGWRDTRATVVHVGEDWIETSTRHVYSLTGLKSDPYGSIRSLGHEHVTTEDATP